MKKAIIEVYFDEKLSDNDILIYQNNRWKAINKQVFLNTVNKNITDLDSKIDEEINHRMDDDNSLLLDINNLKKVVSYILGENYESVLEGLNNEQNEESSDNN